MESDPEERKRPNQPMPDSVGARILVYFGLRDPGGATVEARPPTLRWMVSYSLIWGIVFPLLTGHRHRYLVAVAIAALTMFIVQVVGYGISAWLRRRRAA